MSIDYPWYKKLNQDDSTLEQGDIIVDCQIIASEVEAQGENTNLEGSVAIYDVIVMSQSCDLAQRKIELVLVCPFYPLEEVTERHNHYRDPNLREKLKEGSVLGFHMLNKAAIRDTVDDFLIVDFKNIYSVPIKYLEKIVIDRKNRIRLLPPYKEHLAQAFARFL